MMRITILTLLLALGLSYGGYAIAQDAVVKSDVEVEAATDDSDFEQRLALSREMHKIRSTKTQVDGAVDSVMQRLPQAQQEAFKVNMRSILNYNAIEKISINAMAETFTLEELTAMVEYNQKPEAKSATDKFPDYQKKVGPEIVRMIDKAVMRMRTGGAQ